MRILGTGMVAGEETVTVELTFRDAMDLHDAAREALVHAKRYRGKRWTGYVEAPEHARALGKADVMMDHLMASLPDVCNDCAHGDE